MYAGLGDGSIAVLDPEDAGEGAPFGVSLGSFQNLINYEVHFRRGLIRNGC